MTGLTALMSEFNRSPQVKRPARAAIAGIASAQFNVNEFSSVRKPAQPPDLNLSLAPRCR
jgi:hypothetical protein